MYLCMTKAFSLKAFPSTVDHLVVRYAQAEDTMLGNFLS